MRRRADARTLAVVDAGVLIGAFDGGDVHHEWASRTLLTFGPGRLLVDAVTLAEALVYPALKDEGEASHVRVRALRGRVTAITEADSLELARLRAATRLRMPDAIVVYTAMREGAELLTTDTAVARAARAAGVSVRSPSG